MTPEQPASPPAPDHLAQDSVPAGNAAAGPIPPEIPKPRPDPTRYGDWERNGRCIDF
jgi:hypothetical protein